MLKLVLGLALAGRLAAAPSPVTVWDEALERYNYRVLVDMLVSDLPAGSPEAGRVRRAGDRLLARARLGPRYRATMRAVFPGEKLGKSLDWFLANYLELGDGTLIPVTGWDPRARRPARGRHVIGWDPELARVRREEPHGLEDLEAYLDTHLGRELRPLYLDPRMEHAFVDGDEAAALDLLARWGAERVDRVNACGFNRRRRSLLGSRAGRILLVQHGFESPEQRFNHMARLYFLSGPRGPISPLAVHTWLPEVRPMPDLEAFGRWISSRGPVDTLCFGLVNPLAHRLGEKREQRFGELRVWTASHGSREVLAVSGFGASFGSFPASLLERMARAGRAPRNLLFVGTAGGLAGVEDTTAWLYPEVVFHAGVTPERDGPRIEIANSARALPSARGQRGTVHATVDSILVETRRRVQDWIDGGVCSVDCELSHIVAYLARSRLPARLYVALSVTDLPLGTDRARTGGTRAYISNPSVQYQQARKLYDEILENLEGDPR